MQVASLQSAGTQSLTKPLPGSQQQHPVNSALQQSPQPVPVHPALVPPHALRQNLSVAACAAVGAATETISGARVAAAPTFANRTATSRRVAPFAGGPIV